MEEIKKAPPVIKKAPPVGIKPDPEIRCLMSPALREVIKKSGYKFCFIAEKAGVSNSSFSGLYNRRICVGYGDPRLVKIAVVFGITPEDAFEMAWLNTEEEEP